MKNHQAGFYADDFKLHLPAYILPAFVAMVNILNLVNGDFLPWHITICYLQICAGQSGHPVQIKTPNVMATLLINETW